ncbi:glutathione S-transferase N-terminal domain-containing protein [Sphingomonas sp. CROZ-RG-20F-R02-07]|uniref:glutathione S-transferase N-terminal domain-containing protein n=1 Tax=Sphingomonas sp. CROZ-RG-20F-R02-07 TaxID=2914832 RepID=UPI001F5A45F9|nr:glutathione S-transferase N-terminal domain-containing protein [Sphingomonas sp. CROZ-RG-20F-R02-07]
MKLYDAAWAPSPRRVRIVLAEKDIAVPRIAIDLRAGEQLGQAYLAINPRGTVPALLLDDGELIADSVAICRYFEALQPAPPMFGTTPRDVAAIEGWTRRVEQEGYAAAVYAFRNGNPAFEGRAIPGKWPPIARLPELAARAGVMWAAFVDALDAHLADREWIATDRYTFADVSALVAIDFARAARLMVPDAAANLRRWHAAASARPSAAA